MTSRCPHRVMSPPMEFQCDLPDGHFGEHKLREPDPGISDILYDFAETVEEQCDGQWIIPSRKAVARRLREIADRHGK